MAQLLGVHGSLAAHTNREREETWYMVVLKPKMNDPPVVLHDVRGDPKSKVIWLCEIWLHW